MCSGVLTCAAVKRFLVVPVVAILASLGTACASHKGAPPVEASAAQAQSTLPMVVLRPAGRPEARVRVELARTPEETQRGLMYREKLDPDAGMLFLFPEERPQAFWMKNTFVPLDMIFIRHDRTVLGVVENAEPLTTSSRQVPGASQYVLEVVGGWAQGHGVGPGTPVEFVHVE